MVTEYKELLTFFYIKISLPRGIKIIIKRENCQETFLIKKLVK